MAKKMAVKNKGAKTKKTSSFSVAKYSKPLLKIAAVLSVLSIGVLLLTKMPTAWSDLWPVKNIVFSGEVEHFNAVQVKQLIEKQQNIGMLSIDIETLRLQINKSPWIKDVAIRKRWPDALIFSFQESQPIAVVNSEYLFEDGQTVPRSKNLVENNLLEILVEKVATNSRVELVELSKKLKKIDAEFQSYSFDVARFNIDENRNWTIEIANKFNIKVGRKHQQQRIDRFFKVYAAIENKKNLKNVDLRYNNGLAVQLVETKAKKQQKG